MAHLSLKVVVFSLIGTDVLLKFDSILKVLVLINMPSVYFVVVLFKRINHVLIIDVREALQLLRLFVLTGELKSLLALHTRPKHHLVVLSFDVAEDFALTDKKRVNRVQFMSEKLSDSVADAFSFLLALTLEYLLVQHGIGAFAL